MAFFFQNRYPYTDFHELNLDWIISKIKEVKDAVKVATESAIAAAASEEAAAESAEAAAGYASDIQNELDGKQDVLTAGPGISIVNNIISVSYENAEGVYY